MTSPDSRLLPALLTDPRSIDWQVGIVLAARDFFSIRIRDGVAGPTAAHEFLSHLSDNGWPSQDGNRIEIERILRQMVFAGLLNENPGLPSVPVLGNFYANNRSVTSAQAGGLMWLTSVLGPGFLAPSIGSVTIPVTGWSHCDETPDEESFPCSPSQRKSRTHVYDCMYVRPNIGSGIMLDHEHILTCRHVVEGTHLEDFLEDSAVRFPLGDAYSPIGRLEVKRIDSHPTEDVAVITVDASVSTGRPMAGMAFREPRWGDRVTTFGYPPVAQSQTATLVVQSGEVVNPAIWPHSGDSPELFLVSAITRPGNSGGPIVASDGRIVGMVTQDNLAKTAETSMPFYTGLPAHRILTALNDIGFSDLATMEDWSIA